MDGEEMGCRREVTPGCKEGREEGEEEVKEDVP